MKVHWDSWIARLFLKASYTAFTFREHVFVKYPESELSELRRTRLLKHEAKHIDQYDRYGTVGFLLRYLWYHIRYGYLENPLEIEARKAANA